MTTEITVNAAGDTTLTVTVEDVTTTIELSATVQTLIIENNATAVVAALPSGGTDGQVLAKASNSNFDTEWIDPSADPTTAGRLSTLEYNQAEDRDTLAEHTAGIATLVKNARGRKDVTFLNDDQQSTASVDDSKNSLWMFTGGGGTECRLTLDATGGNIPNLMVAFSAASVPVRFTTTERQSTADDVVLQTGDLKLVLHIVGTGLRDLTNIINDFAFEADAVLAARLSVTEYDIAEIRDTLADNAAWMADIDVWRGDVETYISAAFGRIENSENDIIDLQNRASVIEYDIAEIRDALQQDDVDLTAILNRISVLEYDAAELRDDIDAINVTNSAQGSAITTLQNRASVIEYDIADDRDRLASIEAVNTSQGGTLSSHTSSINALQNRASVIEYDVAEDRDRMLAIEAVNTSQAGTISSHTSTLSSHGNSITALQNRASVIEYDIAELRDDVDVVAAVHVGTAAPTDTRKLWVDTDDTSTDTGWKDLVASGDRANASGANAPTWASFVSGLYAYRFSATAMQEMWLSFHVPHDVKPNTRMIPHFHWSPSGTNTGNCRWGFEYSYAKRDGTPNRVFPASTTVYALQAGSGSALAHQIAEIPNPETDGILVTEPDGIIMVRVFRDGANAADTLTDTAFLLSVDLHYQTDRESTPSRDPDYYT